MVLTALRGALGFLSRFPVGHDGRAWDAFQATPVAFPLAGYLLGVLCALPLLLPLPEATVALLFVLAMYAVTGINHVDGVADLGDAAVVHGDAERRRDVLRDTDLGVGGALAVALVVLGLGTAGLALAGLGVRAAALVLVAEVGAKAGMALLACLCDAPHEGLGSAFTDRLGPRDALLPGALALPVVLVGYPQLLPGALALAAALATALLLGQWADRTLDGVSGDVVGASNEFARVAALHVGVVAWTRF